MCIRCLKGDAGRAGEAAVTWTDAVKAPLIIAAGGGQGYPVERWRGYWPNAAYHLFEVAPQFVATLTQRFGADPKVRITAKALSDTEGPLDFYLNAVAMTSSRLPFNRDSWAFYPQWGGETKTRVEGITLDGYCAANGIDRIGLLELDVQGGELAVLRGAEKLLRRGAIDALMVEVFYTDLYQNVPLAAEVVGYLTGLGYRLAESSGECEHMADLVFIRGAK